MRASRLLSILITLQRRGRVTARELAEMFEVSRRTIFRDIDELSAAGVPVYAERGSAGGFALLGGWRTDLTGLTAAEAEAIFLAGVPEALAALGLQAPAAAARLKLLAALPAGTDDQASRVAERFHLDPLPWGRRAPPADPRLRTVAEAVWSSTRLRLRYESWRGEAVRTIEPLGIVLKAGAWYFLAAGREGVAIHRLDKVRELEILAEGFERAPGFNLAEAWRRAVDRFEANLRRHRARLKIGPGAMDWLHLLPADIAHPVLEAQPGADGWREVEVDVEDFRTAAVQLLGLGDQVVVVSPPALRSELKARALAVADLYPAEKGAG
jgi:predicted DNA-binding transcriptional regulator YafY